MLIMYVPVYTGVNWYIITVYSNTRSSIAIYSYNVIIDIIGD